MSTGNLEALANELSSRYNGEYLTVKFDNNKLYLRLDLNIGVEGFETIHISNTKDNEENYELSYMGTYSQAFTTFLEEGNQDRINLSPILEKFRKNTQEKKIKGDTEIVDSKRKEFNSQFLLQREVILGYNESKDVVVYFADIFSKKVDKYRSDKSI